MSIEDFKERMDYLVKRVQDSDKMQGVDRIYFPGEIEQLMQEKREREGIPYASAEIDALNEEAKRVGVPPLVM